MDAQIPMYQVKIEGFITEKDGTKTPFILTGETPDNPVELLKTPTPEGEK